MYSHQKQRFWILIIAFIFTFSLLITGCGGRLIPRDLKDYVSEELNTPRRNVDVTQPYKTTFIYRLPDVNINDAYLLAEEFIDCVVDFGRREGVSDWLNDSLMFHIRLDSDADVNLKWATSADKMRERTKGKISTQELIDSCTKEENWVFAP
ncbi:hypothetical protein K9N50_12180 [bacterium]|nr:hypothetical protein [bacterium]